MTQVDTTASLGYWVRRRRLALDLTQAALARQVGCATVTISKIERDERRPSRQMASLLADNLAIPETERERFLATAVGERAVHRMPLEAQPLELLIGESDESPRSNLPVPSTPFVGRQAELAQLMQRLEDPACRLLSLVGPGGFGKTRLAIRLGELELGNENLFPDGVFFVFLERLEDPDLVVPAIAAALQITFYGQTGQESQLLNVLARKQLLLILDSAEHILNGDLVEAILERASGIKILVTSREALRLQQEWFHPIAGMGIEQEATEAAGAGGSDAVQFFYQCARLARPGFDLGKELPNVRRICRLVDGAPLAIELAAAWLKVLPCAQIRQELEGSLDFLSTSLRNIPERHRSMRVVLEQSWSYLTGEEQRILRQLSVFVGGFCADAAEQVAGASLPSLAALAEKSVLQVALDGRLRIHGLLRQLAAEKLALHPRELAESQALHCDYYMAFLRDRGKSIVGWEQKRVLKEVGEEYENIRVAWSYAAQHSRFDKLEEALSSLFRFLWTRGRYEEGERLTALALNEGDATALPADQQPLQVQLAARRAQFAAARGEHQRAKAMVEDALVAARTAGCFPEQALCHLVAGAILEYMVEPDSARTQFMAAQEIYQALDDKAGRGETALSLAYISRYTSDPVENQRQVEEALRLFQEIGDISMMADGMDKAAVIQLSQGKIEGVEGVDRRFREGLELAREVGNHLVVAKCIGGLALVAWWRGQWKPAIRLMQERLHRMQDLGHEFEVLVSLNLLCGLYAHAGYHAQAMSLLESHPKMWRSRWTAQAQMGAGAYGDAMGYLPQMTMGFLRLRDFCELSGCMIAWAMVLASDCTLARENKRSGEMDPMPREERTAKAFQILTAIRRCNVMTSGEINFVDKLMADMRGGSPVPDFDAENEQETQQVIEKLAQEMLTIRLA